MTTTLTAMKIPTEPENDQSRIIRPEDVERFQVLKAYFKQRLGPQFEELDFVHINREDFRGLLEGDNALYADLLEKDPEAAMEIMTTYGVGRKPDIMMTFHIENESPGRRVCEFLRKHMRTPFHREWYRGMQDLALKMHKLHWQWKRSSIRYHKIVLPVLGRTVDDEAEALD
jgi:hypothetical protein